MRQKRFVRIGSAGVAAAAMLGATLFGAGQAFAAEPAAAGGDAYALHRPGTVTLGDASFKHHGEHLTVCDRNADGDAVTAELIVRDSLGGSKTYTVTDGNGAKPECGKKNLSLKEGLEVELRVCVANQGCGGRSYGTS
ncbi:hypothetical protein EV191_101985 [Tamaricihabitans halophyticus]|uniref:Neocarzinostatin family protein n=1 Tax=Tamaricihabitans halophyticus TaxID=1262583 RepID=A0A4R2R399_9PSEU|nr:hypothetical protein [Tamaricihabitans halophyticus]TCP57033.1 hypothetical protein EV191_101985 [Tamaricihabitans halophyticus]